ncbi:MAG: threonylcarbamoyl-AMP synthase [Megasphaera sp.]|jgi:L-threonylcarbamoyladenylate synthase|nr:threonylcarbamoyl-AMP synthase [Megasphaera sp.]MCI1248146.1 threonylcarbamoyl-AMP synthase [Megasphaera sp.]
MKHTKIISITDIEKDAAALEEAGRIIRNGGLVVFPTETVYGIGANGLDADACRSIYTAKGRPSDNPLILTVPGKESVKEVAAVITPTAQKLLDAFWPGPLTIIFPRKANVPDAATGGLDTVALRCPAHDVCRAFLRCAGVPVAGPSANLSGRPSPTTAAEVAHDMDGRVDMIIDGGPCKIGVESTIVECNADDTVTILRPGGVTIDMLRQVVGHVCVDTSLVTGKGVPKAPGMKYRHYAPSAPMTSVVGPVEAVTAKISTLYKQFKAEGQVVGFLVSEEVAAHFPQENMYIWGRHGDKTALANQLYTGLLFFDTHTVDHILAEGTDSDGLGMAIMNRMKKASGGDIIII